MFKKAILTKKLNSIGSFKWCGGIIMASASFQNANHKPLNLLSPVLLFHLWLWSRFSWPPLPRSSLSGGRTHKDFRQDWGQPIHSADSLCGKLQLTPHPEQITNTLMSFFTMCVCVCVCACEWVQTCIWCASQRQENPGVEWPARQAIQIDTCKHNGKKNTTTARGPPHQSIRDRQVR